MTLEENAREYWEAQREMWDEEEYKFEESAAAYESYMKDILECVCGKALHRYELDDHWCKELEELNAVHTTS